ncbi:MAG: MgtC/SapB family protein [Candidatus Zixiibacteriota bacterium]|nr:MAG: MgtC/SapB family protein [candidate division Zixibacteria bacterium]
MVALFCGGVIGLEREWAGKSAGLRTMILICIGSTLYMSLSMLAAMAARQPFDVTRVAAQVASGIGFLGAGTIIVARGQVHGLTTAATIWVVAAIGLLVGAGYPIFGMLATGIVLGILLLIGLFEKKLLKQWLGKREGYLDRHRGETSEERDIT